MTSEQRDVVLLALRHGHNDPELDEVLKQDLAALEPLIDEWLREAEATIPQGSVLVPGRLLAAIYHALESYQYGNGAPHLAIFLCKILKPYAEAFLYEKWMEEKQNGV